MSDPELCEKENFELPINPHSDGLSYLYELFRHLTSSKQLFTHKLSILLQLSRDVNKTYFTRAEMETMFPQYPKNPSLQTISV